MKNKALVLGLILVVGAGLAVLPTVSAEWGGGDGDPNTGDSPEDDNDDSGDDGDSSDEDDSDSDSEWGGGDGDPNTGDDNEGEVPEDDDSDDSDTGSGSSGSSSGNVHVIDGLTADSLDAWLSEESISLGSSTTVEGDLDDEDNEDREIEIYLEDEHMATAVTNSDGVFEEEITPENAGEQTVRVEKDHLDVELDLQVTDGDLSIDGLTSTIGDQAGDRTTVCGNVNSNTEDTEVTLYHNDQEFETQTGTGQICFDPILQEGQNNFRMIAEANGETVEEETSRDIGENGNGETPDETLTGSFLGSTARTGLLGILGLLGISGAAAFLMRKKGYTITRQPV